MGKLIDADALIFDLKTSLVPQSVDYTNAVGIALRWLRKTPEAVVRCKDCRRCDGFPEKETEPNEVGICRINMMAVKPNDFCSYGERRADDDK